MSGTKKHKIIKLSDEEYNAYIMSLKNDAPLYGADGELFVPESLTSYEEDERKSEN